MYHRICNHDDDKIIGENRILILDTENIVCFLYLESKWYLVLKMSSHFPKSGRKKLEENQKKYFNTPN